MEKTKKILISLTISLTILLILNFILTSNFNSDYVEIPLFNKDMLKGEKISSNNIVMVKVKKQDALDYIPNSASIENINQYVILTDVFKGQIVRDELITDSSEIISNLENYECVTLPITTSSNITCSKLKTNDVVTVYFTAKSKDVSNLLNDKERIYSTTNDDSIVTCRLLENVEVISKNNNSDVNNKNLPITDLLVRLTKKDAMLITNLKKLGDFDVVLN